MSEVLEYRGYIGSAEVDVENQTLVGKLLFIRDVVTYTAETPKDLMHAFEEAVEDYLQTCIQVGKEADTPCKGTFNVRVGPDMHKKVQIAARRENIGLNDFVVSALSASLEGTERKVQHLHRHEVVVVNSSESRNIIASTSALNEGEQVCGTAH